MTKVNDKYYVPVEIDRKWELQEWQHGWTPSYNDPDNSGCHPMQEPTGNSYPTLESDSAYWASKAGVKMGEGEFWILVPELCGDESFNEYAAPIQHANNNNTDMTVAPHDEIQAYMGEYFQRWPQYKDRLTSIEWYHLFLDFYDNITALSLPKQDNGDAWDEVWEKFKEKYGVRALDTQTLTLFNYLKQHYSISKI